MTLEPLLSHSRLLAGGMFRVWGGVHTVFAMEEVGFGVVSLGDEGGPFEPFLEDEGDELLLKPRPSPPKPVEGGHSRGLDVVPCTVTGALDKSPTKEVESKSLPSHAYSRVGRIPPGTYSRSAICGRVGSSPVIKIPRPGRGSSSGPRLDECVVRPMETKSSYVEISKGRPSRIRFM